MHVGLDRINSGTVSTIITLKNASGCAINITGGTEVGHASGTYSHYNGYRRTAPAGVGAWRTQR